MVTTQREKEDRLFNKYQEQLKGNDLPGALTSIDKLLRITVIKAYVSSLKVDVLMQMNKHQEALVVAKEGLQYDNPPSKLYNQHAQLLASLASDSEDLEAALISIDTAINLYNSDATSEDISPGLQNEETFKFWIENKTRTRSEMTSLRADIKSTLNAVRVYEKVQQIENNISQEKVKTIELMAIFTAILALIFANVQFIQKLQVWEIVLANFSLLIAITWLMYIVHRIGLRESFLPTVSAERINKFTAFTLLICILALTILLLIYLSVLLYRWVF